MRAFRVMGTETPRARIVRILNECEDEMTLIDERYKDTNDKMPDGTGALYKIPARNAKAECQAAAFNGTCTWAKVLREEVYEALEINTNIDSANVAELRAELIQVAAVALKWVEVLDKRKNP